MKFTFTDLFAGIGGFHIAMHNLGGKLVSAVEWDERARDTYIANFAKGNEDVFFDGKFFDDITQTNPKDIPDHDILCAGFPCQAFSIAGYRKGFEDSRGNVFFDLCRIIDNKKPSVIFLENVKNLKSHDEGNTYQIIEKTLTDLGYHITSRVLNSCKYGGVPQNRERIYIIGFRDKKAFNRFSFPDPVELNLGVRDMLDKKVNKDFYYNGKPLFEKLVNEINDKNTAYQRRRQYVRANKSGVFPTLTANMGTGGHNVPLVLENDGIRKLTPRECFRIQGFPESFILPEIANSQLYKQAGNAVTVPTIQRIAEKILMAQNIKYENLLKISKKFEHAFNAE